MSAWSEDPELLETFRAEVDERLSSLSSGLLQLEATPKARSLTQGLLRDAHTLKGSARMLGLGQLVDLTHQLEDVLVGIREGRLAVTRELVDLLLATCEAVRRGAPGGDASGQGPEVRELLARLADAVNPVRESARADPPVRVVGHEVGAASSPSAAPVPAPSPPRPAPTAPVASLRVSVPRVRELLDAVEELDHDARRLDRILLAAADAGADLERWLQAVGVELPTSTGNGLATALLRLRAAASVMTDAVSSAGDVAQDHRDRVAVVRERALALALVPVRNVLTAYPTLVRGLAANVGADVGLVLTGEEVELDKRVLDAVSDALGHLVTNAVDHGCRPPQERRRSGKPERCSLTVGARNAGGTVVITVADDGDGVDREALARVAGARGLVPAEGLSDPALLDLLFHPGLSTRATVGPTSGRGVGLDVVRSSVGAVGGSVSVVSPPGHGTTFEVVLPVSLGVVHCLLAEVGGETYAIPVTAVHATVSLEGQAVQRLAGAPTVVHDGVALPLLDLAAVVGVCPRGGKVGLIAQHPQGSAIWSVDALVGESDVVVRDLGGFLSLDGGVPGITGATFGADGSVVCVLDLREAASQLPGAPAVPTERRQVPAARVLVVEDSVGVRELERAVLTSAGYDVTTCNDGSQGALRLHEDPYDLVLSDVEMPE